MRGPRTAFLAFGRDGRDSDPYCDDAPWWPLYIDDGPHLAESAAECIATVRERLELGGEKQWTEIAVVPVSAWVTE